MNYKYLAYKTDKQIIEGTIDALTEKMAQETLYQAGFKYVLNLQALAPHKDIYQLIPSLFGVKNADIIDFSRQLATFIESGSSLHTALGLLNDQATKPALKNLISGIIEKLEGGNTFSQAVKDYPNVFTRSYGQIVQSSEKAGELEKGLRQIADYMEKRATITAKIRRAMSYPIFVICLAIGVVILLITTILPPLLKLFASYQTALPPVTLFALGLMNFLIDYKFLILIVISLFIAAIIILSRFASGKLFIDRLMLRTPVFGTILLHHNLGYFCRTTSMLLKAGLPLPNIMDNAIQTVNGNQIILRALIKLKDKLMQGEGFARPLAQEPLFPRMMVRMISVGEQTGTLDVSLETLATYYEENTDKRIQSLIALIEPTLTVVIGIGIAFIMISMVLPIYTIINHVR